MKGKEEEEGEEEDGEEAEVRGLLWRSRSGLQHKNQRSIRGTIPRPELLPLTQTEREKVKRSSVTI